VSDVLIIGGGAAGLAAAISAAMHGDRVTVLERMDRVGKKILATGNGRCNIAAADPAVSHYYGKNPRFIQSALSRFPLENTIDFFTGIGVPLKTEGNKFFPYSLQASSVVDALRLECARLHIEIHTEQPVTNITRTKEGFSVQTPVKTYFAHAVLIACGGCASASLGGVSDGYTLLESFGHKRTALLPAIVQLKTNAEHAKPLSGIKLDAAAHTLKGNALAAGDKPLAEVAISLRNAAKLQATEHSAQLISQIEKLSAEL